MCIVGNNFGDCVHITPLHDNRICLYASCSCAVAINSIVPNEFLSILIDKCIAEYGSVENFLRCTKYDEEYKEKLIAKVVNHV